MAKRRKVGNLLALGVLSTIVFRPMHPYEIASRLKAWGKERDMGIKWGSLYTVVANLEKHGFIEAVGSTRQGGRPERTTYRITEAGRAEMIDWIRELVSTPEREALRFTAGLSVIVALGPDEAADLLRQRLAALEKDLADQREVLAHAAAELPRILLIEAEYEIAIRAAEAEWVRSFLAELDEGTLADVEMWRTFHKTGQMPPEL